MLFKPYDFENRMGRIVAEGSAILISGSIGHKTKTLCSSKDLFVAKLQLVSYGNRII